MKKYLAILTVMTMVLTTLVVPTVAYGNPQDGNQVSNEIGINIRGNGGTFTFKYTDDTSSDDMKNIGAPATIDSGVTEYSVGDLINKVEGFKKQENGEAISVDSLVIGQYWDQNRKFAGWRVFTDKQIINQSGELVYEQVELAKVGPTGDILNQNILLDGVSYINIEALWEGDNSSYMCNVSFDSAGGQLEITNASDNQTRFREGFDVEIRKDGATIGQQLEEEENNISNIVATKDQGSFEYWIQCDARGNLIFDDELASFDNIKDIVLQEDITYIAKWSDISEERYQEMYGGGGPGPDGEGDGGEYGDPEYDVPDDMIQVEYNYYNDECDYVYDGIAIAPDGKSTYRELLQQAEAQHDHYDALETPEYRYDRGSFSDGGNWDSNMLDDIARGGLILYADVSYPKLIVKTEVQYYDANNNYVSEKEVVVVPHGSNYQKVLNQMRDLSTVVHYNEYDFQGWAYGDTPGGGFDLNRDGPNENNDYFIVAAKYNKYPVNIKYSYPVSDGRGGYKAVTEQVKRIVSVDGNGTSLIEACRALDCDGKTYSKWHINSLVGVGGNPTPFCQEFEIAAEDTATGFIPVFVFETTLEEEHGYYEKTDKDTVYYIKDDNDIRDTLVEEERVYQEIGDNPPTEQQENQLNQLREISDQFGVLVCEEGAKYYRHNGSKMKFREFSCGGVSKNPDIENSPFISGIGCPIDAIYDKILISLSWADSDGEVQKEQRFVESGTYLTMPYNNNHVQLWDVGGAHFGGSYWMSGTERYITEEEFGSYVYLYSRYSIGIEELTETSEGIEQSLAEIKLMLKEKALEDKNFVEAKIQTKYMDVELNKRNDNGNWEKIHEGQFPASGLVLYLPYPEGTSAETHDFSVTHLIASNNHPGKDKGDIEVLAVEETELGLKVTVRSLSPIAITYQEAGVAGGVSTAIDNAVDTGDNFTAIPFIAVMAIALAGVAVAMFRRKTTK